MMSASQEVTNHLIKARDLATLACHEDENNNLSQAIQHYDEAILFIDEVLGKIPNTCDAWQLLMIYREKYNNRMEQLRYIEISQRDSVSSSVSVTQPIVKPKRRMSKIPFNDKMSPIHLNCESREDPPTSLLLRPYWLLRVLRKVIQSGGYISPKVYVPKLVWSQYGVKFTGLSTKTTAFEQILIAIKGRVFLIESPADYDNLSTIIHELKHLTKELMQLQNNLSKPLTYIPEVTIMKDCHPSPAKTSNVGRLSHMVSNIGKNVFKSVESSVHRIGASLPTRMDDEDLLSFATLAAELCEKCQILCRWTSDIELELESLQQSVESDLDSLQIQRKHHLQDILMELQLISAFMRDVICEILLRDTEFLLERYLRKMRKSFSRMYWDDEPEDR